MVTNAKSHHTSWSFMWKRTDKLFINNLFHIMIRKPFCMYMFSCQTYRILCGIHIYYDLLWELLWADRQTSGENPNNKVLRFHSSHSLCNFTEMIYLSIAFGHFLLACMIFFWDKQSDPESNFWERMRLAGRCLSHQGCHELNPTLRLDFTIVPLSYLLTLLSHFQKMTVGRKVSAAG